MKIKNYLMIFVISFIAVYIFIPQLRELILFFINILWEVFKSFFLKDFLYKKLVYLGLLIFANILGFYLTRKQKRKLLYCVGGGLDIIGLLLIIKL